jgi:hypothetical protein
LAVAIYNADRLTEGKQKNLDRLSVLKNYTHLVNFDGILDGKPVPVSDNIFRKLEKQNPEYYFNVYAWDPKEGMQPLIISKNYERKYQVNLMVLTEQTIDGKDRTHYIWIKDLSKLIYSNTKYKGKKHLCTRCVQYMSSEKVLQKHQKYCHGHRDAPQPTELPEKGKNILQFRKWKHMMRAPCVIYSDFEAYNKKLPDGEKFHGQIKKLTENIPNSYHIIVKWSDGAIWADEHPYRGENPTEQFIKDLEKIYKDIEFRLYENYDIRKHKDEPEFKEEYEKAMAKFKKADKCWICKKGFQNANKEKLASGNKLKAEAQKITNVKEQKKAMDKAMNTIRAL